ncbi:unnamed protein product [Callosobruchus maculatus]|uniref:Uncharacterized protein n=1 Tax=Callosobruchus maculatus TaxID=64391 RepID=A0A653C033_CALMS|nr:unnamed protein product [Callosobruchus maculatus]
MKSMMWKEFSLQDLKTKLKVGDHIRIYKVRGIFDKNINQIGQQHITDLYDEGCPNLVTLKKTFKYRHCFKHFYNNLNVTSPPRSSAVTLNAWYARGGRKSDHLLVIVVDDVDQHSEKTHFFRCGW